MVSEQRNYGIDLLRIVAMFMVLLLHIMGWGVLYNTEELSLNYGISWFVEIASYCAVNCYAIISGYVGYGRKTKYSNLMYIVLCGAFYAIIMTIVGCLVFPQTTIREAVRSLLHMRTDGWWYLKAYFCAFLFFPHINFLVEKYEKNRLYILCLVMFLFLSVVPTLLYSDVFKTGIGYSPWWLMLMYYVGTVIKKYNVGASGRKIKYLLLYIVMVLLTFISKIGIGFATKKIFGEVILSDWLIAYTSPTIVLAAIFLVLYFKRIEFNKYTVETVKVLTPLTFGVYLVHTQYFSKKWFANRFEIFAHMNPLLLIAGVLTSAVVIYFLCSLVDYVRQALFEKFRIKKLCEKAEKKLLEKIRCMF